ncbi:MAG: acyl-CoA thioesterase [Clostridia bacterium]|nr:acyl-CoA thioesterase [Clostridia bacterium]
MQDYLRKVHYHETDKMGITHHSNYIKWMEEARIAYLDELGYGYARLEEEGISSPVIGVECRYKNPTVFDDTVAVHACVEEYSGVRMTIGYMMTNVKTGRMVCEGKTMHCFTDREGRPVILKKKCPELHALFSELMEGS